MTYDLSSSSDIQRLIKIAYSLGWRYVEDTYPYMPRSPEEAETLAKKVCEEHLKPAGKYKATYQPEKYPSFFIPAYKAGYLETIAKKDAAQTTSTATIQVKKVEHKDGTHTYRITLTDARYLPKTYEFIVQIAADQVNLQES